MVLIASLVAPRIASAQPVWSADAATARAVQHGPRVQSARLSLLSAEAIRAFAQVPRIGNPYLGVRLMVGVPDIPAATIGVVTGLPIDVSDRPGAFSREVRWALREAQHGVDVAVIDARFDALEAWVQLSLAQERVDVARALVQNARALRDRVEARVNERAATALDLSLAARDLATSEAELGNASHLLADAQARFREALALSPTAEVRATPASAPSLPDHSREQLATLAASRRAEPMQLDAGARRALAQGERAVTQAVDPLFIAGEFEWQGYQQSSFGLSLNGSLPIVRRAQGERALSIAESTALSTRADLARRSIAREAVGAYDRLRARIEALEALSSRALPAARRVVQATEQLFESGAVDTFRVLSARRELAALELRLVEARLDAWRARVALERAVGGL